MRLTSVLAVLLVVTVVGSSVLPVAFSLPPLENGMVFPAGTLVIPMDQRQAERIVVFGFVHALLRAPNPIQLFRIIEPPNVTLSTNMTASPVLFAGGPFLIMPGDVAKVNQIRNQPGFEHVTVARLTSQHILSNVFRVRDPTKILVVEGLWGRTDITLDQMKIPYDVKSREALAANPSLIFSYSLIVVDCYGWSGKVPTQIASNLRSHVSAGNEVIFTDIALKDMNSTFPGYVTLWGPQPQDRTANAYVYNAPRKYDPAKYGSSADRLPPEFPSQYYGPPPHGNEIKIFTESAGYVVSSVAPSKVNDVRIMADSKNYGNLGTQYAILAFYFQYGEGIVEGLAFHPQQQNRFQIGDLGYYAVHQVYGNKFVHGPPSRWFDLTANPTTATRRQGQSASYAITVTSYSAFNSPVKLSVTGVPPAATTSFSPAAPQPPIGGTASSTFTVTTTPSTPIGTYTMNITGTEQTTPPTLNPMIRWVIVTLTVTIGIADFSLSVSPNSLSIETGQSKTALVAVTSIGIFNQNVTLAATGMPSDVTVSFTPPSVIPPAGGIANSIMRVNVGLNAVPGTYNLTITGSNGTKTIPVPFTLTITRPPLPPAPPNWTLFLLLLAAMLGVALALIGLAISYRKRKAPVPQAPRMAPVQAPGRPQRMYVVPMAGQRVRCSRCGRPIAVEARYCPYCRQPRGVAVISGFAGPGLMSRGSAAGRRAVWGFALAMTSGILILLNAASLLSPGFWGAPTNWSSIFWWLGASWGLGQSLGTFIGIVAGFIMMTGGLMMLMRKGVLGALVAFPFAVISILIGGGFIAGTALGIAAGILGAVGK